MKFVSYLLLITLVFTSCKTTKNATNTSKAIKEMSAKKVAKKHVLANFDKNSVETKMKVNFNNGKTKQSLAVIMRMQKDQVIWLKGNKFITVFKAKITPTKVSYYSPFAKNYFEGDFSMITKLLGVEISFEQLQNLFLGQALQNLKEEKQTLSVQDNSYILSPEKQKELFNIFFAINPSNFKLDKQSIVNTEKNQLLTIEYPSYNLVNNVLFPSEINIKAKQANKFTNIDLMVKSVEFDTNLDTSFSIPKGYKQINL